MQQILSVWSNLDPKRRLIVIGATVLMFAAILGLSRMATKPSMALLYSGLESSAAGEVVQSLEAQGVVYEIRGGAIFVPTNVRDELRMTLASEGLPANSTSGYELLDSLSGFGTTSQMFDAAYWRAKEGEIARTIVSSPQIRSARVLIANPSSQPFKRQIAASASVTVITTSGALSTDQAKAFRYLVASAVSGLAPEDVSVIDGRSGVVMSGDDTAAGASSSTDRADELRQNVQRLLEARVGVGKAVVEVSLETVTDQESIFEHRFDPEGRVAISSETEERSNSSQDSGDGSVTVASNLPNGAGAAGGDSSSNNSETRERVNYEVSETRREVQRGPGAIKRLTVAVLVDGIRTLDPNTEETIWTPRSEEELAALSALVTSAIGLDETRGDQITIKTMEFEPLLVAGTEAQSSLISGINIDLMSIIQLAVLAVVSLVLGLFVLRPILSKPTVSALPAPPDSAERSGMDNMPATIPMPEMPRSNVPALNGEIDGGFELPTLGVVSDFDFGDEEFGISNDPVKRLKRLIEDRQDETVEILRGWMEDTEENA
ncbi:MAG: flagellar M-ring protein FliF [Alphaproteobacteria bacterium]|nr:flagellar M-ring protein FliF [Alphaproteobacteria bacterium]MBU1573091.1 flagellar M-ring protein FliF [Alphaproteobacteria bacterium]MBU2077079.1 flagellar M-ring protein FliF [Alphaproteobacteria bacterium]MBU2161331.1 flagellar M-ring protein FliF [Alphaproteobacteria bacterium]MBU2242286.1 flagellar M-ring protein FliF [Alphaproteobacteria bacterium]